MAEVVGLLASVMQMADAAKGAVKTAIDVKDAPENIREAAAILSAIFCVLVDLDKQYTSNSKLQKLKPVVDSFGRDLVKIITGIEEFNKTSMFSDKHMSTRRRFGWVTYGSKDFEQALANLSMYMKTFQLAFAGDTNGAVHEGFKIMEENQKTAERHLNEVRICLETMKEDQQTLKRTMTMQEKMNQREKIGNWLSTLDYTATHDSKVEKRTPGTGEWIFREPDYVAWKGKAVKARTDVETRTDAELRLLWCHGVPGAGKSFIASAIIEDLVKTTVEADSEKVGLAYIYCNYKEQQPDARDYLAAILKQLTLRLSETPKEIIDLFEEKKNSRLTMEMVVNFLKLVVKKFDFVYVVIDALDEFRPAVDDEEERRSLVNKLKSLDKVSLLVTSRPNLEPLFKGAPGILICAHDEDVRAFIKSFITVQPTKLRRKLEGSDSLQETIIETILLRSDKMFLLAQLLLEHVNEQKSLNKIVACLERLPNSLDVVYSKMIDRVGNGVESNRELGMQVLSWIALARRELTVAELREAIAATTPPADSEKYDIKFYKDGLVDADEILAYCEGLVTMDENGKVRFIHKSLQEFLLKRTDQTQMMFTGQDVAFACIRYLSMIAAEVPSTIFEVESPEELEQIPSSNPELEAPLTSGAQENPQMAHFEEQTAPAEERSEEEITDTLHPPDSSVTLDITGGLVGTVSDDVLLVSSQPRPDGQCAHENGDQFGPENVPSMPDSEGECQRDSQDEISQLALSTEDQSDAARDNQPGVEGESASGSESEEDRDSDDEDSDTELQDEYYRRHRERLQMARKKELQARDCQFLSYAAHFWGWHVQNSMTATKHKLEDDIDGRLVECVRNFLFDNKKALRFTALAVDSLDEDEYDTYLRVGIITEDDVSPLHIAAWHGLTMFVEEALSRGFTVDLKDEDENTALHIAVYDDGRIELIRFLLEQPGCARLLDVKNVYSMTPIDIAAEKMNDTEVLLHLISVAYEHIPNFSIDSCYDGLLSPSLLMNVCWHNDVDALKQLFAYPDFNPNKAVDYSGYPPLHAVLRFNATQYADVIRFLIAQDSVNINTGVEGHQQTPLHIACGHATDTVVKWILERPDVDVNSLDGDGDSPIVWAVEKSLVDNVAVMLERDDLDLDWRNKKGWTVLDYAKSAGFELSIPMLEEAVLLRELRRNFQCCSAFDDDYGTDESLKDEDSESESVIDPLTRASLSLNGTSIQSAHTSQQQNTTPRPRSSASIGSHSLSGISGSEFGSSSWSLFSDLHPSTGNTSFAPSFADLKQPFRAGMQRSQTFQQTPPSQRLSNQQQSPFKLGKRSMSFGATQEVLETQFNPATINMMSLSGLALVPPVHDQTKQGPSSDPTNLPSHHFSEATKDGMRSQPMESSAYQLQQHPSSYFQRQHTYPRAGVELKNGEESPNLPTDWALGEDPVKTSIELMLQMRMQMRRMQKQLAVNQRRMMTQFARNQKF